MDAKEFLHLKTLLDYSLERTLPAERAIIMYSEGNKVDCWVAGIMHVKGEHYICASRRLSERTGCLAMPELLPISRLKRYKPIDHI